jgi:hypothetical protein
MSEKDSENADYSSNQKTPPSPEKYATQSILGFTRRVFSDQVDSILSTMYENPFHFEQSPENPEEDCPQIHFDRAYVYLQSGDLKNTKLELEIAFNQLYMQGIWYNIIDFCKRGRSSDAQQLTLQILRIALIDVDATPDAADCVIEIVQCYIDQTCSSVN